MKTTGNTFLILLAVMPNFSSLPVTAQRNVSVSFEQILNLKNYTAPVISPDGKTIIFTVRTTDWINNTYDNELWISHEGQVPIPLTRTLKGSSMQPRFTPDSRFVSFLADRGEKTQLFIISIYGGEALQVTKEEEGLINYEWHPAGNMIAYSRPDPETKKAKVTKDKLGSFAVEGEPTRYNHLWLLRFNYDSLLQSKVEKPSRLTDGDFTVAGFEWNRGGNQIAFNKLKDQQIESTFTADIMVIDINTRNYDATIENPSGDFFGAWSPDGTAFAYISRLDNTSAVRTSNNLLFIYNLKSKSSLKVASEIDESLTITDWNNQGLFVIAQQKTRQKLYKVDIKTGRLSNIPIALDLIENLSFSTNSENIAVSGRIHDQLNEVYSWKMNQPLKKITQSSQQISGWNTPVNEIISWKSADQTTIEGILIKPRNYNPSKKYPLLLMLHGGPRGADFPEPIPGLSLSIYPIFQWVEKGAIVLRINFRGSSGYGERFRSLSIGKVGISETLDVLSGIEYLSGKGIIDTSRMGVMGWSWGGYLSAYLLTHTTVFKAISVGAGITDWIHYYTNTDITSFTREYLQGVPWKNMSIYLKTAPMSAISNASAPTLIQHGELDKRVPIGNAYELYRGLQDLGVPSKMIVYKGFGHVVNKPKEQLALLWHNWQWFNKYIFDEDEILPIE